MRMAEADCTQQGLIRLLCNNVGVDERLLRSCDLYDSKGVAGVTSIRQLHLRLVNNVR